MGMMPGRTSATAEAKEFHMSDQEAADKEDLDDEERAFQHAEEDRDQEQDNADNDETSGLPDDPDYGTPRTG
jgi:hypothetical protein